MSAGRGSINRSERAVPVGAPRLWRHVAPTERRESRRAVLGPPRASDAPGGIKCRLKKRGHLTKRGAPDGVSGQKPEHNVELMRKMRADVLPCDQKYSNVKVWN